MMDLSKFDCNNVVACASVLILVAIVVVYSGKPASSHVAWAYHIGDQPLFRLLYLVAVLFAAERSLPIAILAVTLYMLINSMIPVLSQVDEGFIWSGTQGAPVASCDVYSAESVKRVGTPFYPMNDSPAVMTGPV